MAEFDLSSVTVDTSSIGPQWPPKETSFNRIKGFYNKGIIDHQDDLEDVLSQIAEMAYSLEDDTADRLSIRLVLSNVVLNHHLSILEKWTEALIPLEGTQNGFEDSSILYIGYNRCKRQSDPEDLEILKKNYQASLRRKQLSYNEMIDRIEKQGYNLQMVDDYSRVNDENFIDQLEVLYGRFGWSRNEVESIMSKKNNLVVVAKDENKIVSAGIAEMSVINFTNQSNLALRIVELTEAATLEEYGGRGLYTGVSTALLCQLNLLSKENGIFGGEIDIVFGECNGYSPGVLNAAKSQGRIFSAEISKRSNLPFPGILRQHVPIQGSERRALYNDLFPAYLNRKRLYTLSRS